MSEEMDAKEMDERNGAVATEEMHTEAAEVTERTDADEYGDAEEQIGSEEQIRADIQSGTEERTDTNEQIGADDQIGTGDHIGAEDQHGTEVNEDIEATDAIYVSGMLDLSVLEETDVLLPDNPQDFMNVIRDPASFINRSTVIAFEQPDEDFIMMQAYNKDILDIFSESQQQLVLRTIDYETREFEAKTFQKIYTIKFISEALYGLFGTDIQPITYSSRKNGKISSEEDINDRFPFANKELIESSRYADVGNRMKDIVAYVKAHFPSEETKKFQIRTIILMYLASFKFSMYKINPKAERVLICGWNEIRNYYEHFAANPCFGLVLQEPVEEIYIMPETTNGPIMQWLRNGIQIYFAHGRSDQESDDAMRKIRERNLEKGFLDIQQSGTRLTTIITKRHVREILCSDAKINRAAITQPHHHPPVEAIRPASNVSVANVMPVARVRKRYRDSGRSIEAQMEALAKRKETESEKAARMPKQVSKNKKNTSKKPKSIPKKTRIQYLVNLTMIDKKYIESSEDEQIEDDHHDDEEETYSKNLVDLTDIQQVADLDSLDKKRFQNILDNSEFVLEECSLCYTHIDGLDLFRCKQLDFYKELCKVILLC